MPDRPAPALWSRPHGPAELGAFLREVRLRADLTQEQLAEEVGVDRRYVYQLESGRGTLYAERLFAVLDELGIEIRLEAR